MGAGGLIHFPTNLQAILIKRIKYINYTNYSVLCYTRAVQEKAKLYHFISGGIYE